MRHFARHLLAVLVMMSPVFASAGNPVAIRQGRHGEMGRLVFDFPAAESFRSQQNGSMLTLEFTPAQPIAAIALHIPGLDSMQGGAGEVRLQLAAGAAPCVYRLGNRIVVDARPGPAGRRTAKLPAPAALPIHLAALTPAAARPAVTPAINLIAPVMRAAAPAASPDVSMRDIYTRETIDFATQPGAAAFRRANLAILVFDTPEVPDLTALQSSPLFAGARLTSLQDAQVVSIPLPVADALALTPVSGGWRIATAALAQPVPPPPQTTAAAVVFPMASASRSIIISDPLTGGDLLVGTVTQAGNAADYQESGPGYAVLPTWLGIAIVPQADNLGLNASLQGFELASGAPSGLPLGKLPAPLMNAAAALNAGQSLALPRGSTAALWKQLLADQLAAAILPPLGRLNAQIALAQDMLALGMGAEANGVLATAVLENPAAQDNGQIAELRAIANVLSHHSRQADFTAPGIAPSPELAFWRAAALADQGQTAQASPGLIAGLALFETYPDALRNTMTAEIAEALADNGRLQAARQLVNADPGNPLLDLARAKILEDQRQTNAALAAYRTLAGGDDDRVGAIAAARLVELRLAAGQLNAGQAADALDAQLFDWRAPEHERHMRLRIAQLRAAAGQWPQAFTMLQSARSLFPGHRGQIDAIRNTLFLKMLGGSAFTQLSPIAAVAVLQQNQDLMPHGNASMQLINLLAQRLDELDLPGAAAPMLSGLIQTIPQGPAQASLGATLAQVDLDAGSPVAALADLSQTQADNLPAELTARRGMLAAKAQAAAGNAIAAVNILAPISASANQTAPADAEMLGAQAQIAEQSGQWPQAQQALSALAGQSVPPSGPLSPDQENLLLRLATAASHNNDAATLALLSTQYGQRMRADAAGQMFQTLTAPPLSGDQGLNQALREIAELQALPALVNAAAGTSTPPVFSAPLLSQH